MMREPAIVVRDSRLMRGLSLPDLRPGGVTGGEMQLPRRKILGLPAGSFCALLGFLSIATVAVCHHTPWEDEAQAWLIARDLTLPGIFHQMGYEGTPPLWHLLLRMLIRLHLPYSALGFVSLALTAGAMYIWLRWSPVPPILRLLVPFAFYFQYQYAVVARSYALTVLLAFAAAALWRAQPRRLLFLALVLALLAQTNLYGFTMAAGISLALLVEYLQAFREQPPSRRQILEISAAVGLVLASLVLAKIVASPVPDCSSWAANTLKTGNRVTSVLAAIGGIQYLFRALSLNPSWGEGLLFVVVLWLIAIKKRMFVLPLLLTVLMTYKSLSWVGGSWFSWQDGLTLMLMMWFFVVKKPLCALPFVLTMLAMGLIWSRPWHFGMALTAFLVSLWSAWPEALSSESKYWTKILQWVLVVLLVAQIPLTLRTIRNSVTGEPYSGAKDAAEFLRPFVGKRPVYGIYYVAAVQPYFGKNIFDNQRASYWIWSDKYKAETRQALQGVVPDDTLVVLPWGTSVPSETELRDPVIALLARQHMRQSHTFCGKMRFLDESQTECLYVYEKSAR